MKKLHIAHADTKAALCNFKRNARVRSALAANQLYEIGKIHCEKQELRYKDGIIEEDDPRLCKMCLAILHDGWTVQTKD